MDECFFEEGLEAVNSGNLEHGVRCFTQAVMRNPNDAETVACLGQTLFWLGRREEGLVYLRQAGKLLLRKVKKSKDISEIVALTEQLQSCNDYEGSIKPIQQAIQLNKTNPRAFQLLARGYSRTNQNNLALVAGRLALKLAPDLPAMKLFMAHLEARAGHAEIAKQQLENALDQSNALTAEEVYAAHKELAAILDKLGEFDRVFQHLHAAAAQSPSLPDFQAQDLGYVPDLLASYKKGFDLDLFQRWKPSDFTYETPAPVFLIGFLRSGTTLAQEVLAAHSRVYLADETEFIAATGRELARIAGNAGTMPDQLRCLNLDEIKHLRRFYWRQVEQRFGKRNKQSIFVDKTTLNTIELGLINCVFPDAKVLFVLRDPRDVCLSCFMQTMLPSSITIHLATWQSTIDFYVLVMKWWIHIKQYMTLRFYEFRYEDAVIDFNDTFAKVFDFIELPWESDVSEFHRRAAKKFIASPSYHQVSLPIYKSSLGRWRNYSNEFAALGSDFRAVMVALGYLA